MVERQTPNLRVGGSNPSWPARYRAEKVNMNEVFQFFNEVKVELTKVVWPKFDEWVGSTVIVLVLVAAFALYLYFVDSVLSVLVHRIFEYYSI